MPVLSETPLCARAAGPATLESCPGRVVVPGAGLEFGTVGLVGPDRVFERFDLALAQGDDAALSLDPERQRGRAVRLSGRAAAGGLAALASQGDGRGTDDFGVVHRGPGWVGGRHHPPCLPAVHGQDAGCERHNQAPDVGGSPAPDRRRRHPSSGPVAPLSGCPCTPKTEVNPKDGSGASSSHCSSEALIERQLRNAMKQHDVANLAVYPEDCTCTAPHHRPRHRHLRTRRTLPPHRPRRHRATHLRARTHRPPTTDPRPTRPPHQPLPRNLTQTTTAKMGGREPTEESSRPSGMSPDPGPGSRSIVGRLSGRGLGCPKEVQPQIQTRLRR